MDNRKKDGLQSQLTDCDSPLDQQFWDTRWASNQIGWDIGFASPAITECLAHYPDKKASVLIPGCGNAHEAKYLLEHGFSNITLLDISPTAVGLLKEKFIKSPQVNILCGDFFQHHGKYDLLIEQTFFCTLPLRIRVNYVEKTTELLKEGGEIVGVLFDRVFNTPGPPFGGDVDEYKAVFESHFEILKMEECYNSVPQRAGSELFIRLRKK